LTAYVSITGYGADAVTVCPDCDQRTSHGRDDVAAVLDAAEHNAGHHHPRHRDAA
jgi:hypothetical protein